VSEVSRKSCITSCSSSSSSSSSSLCNNPHRPQRGRTASEVRHDKARQ
jgi:hypothetical protein